MKFIKITLSLFFMSAIALTVTAKPKPQKSRDKFRLGYDRVVVLYECVDGKLVATHINCWNNGNDRCRLTTASMVGGLGFQVTELTAPEMNLIDNLFDFTETQLNNNILNGAHSQFITIQYPDATIKTLMYTITWTTNTSGGINEEITVVEIL